VKRSNKCEKREEERRGERSRLGLDPEGV